MASSTEDAVVIGDDDGGGVVTVPALLFMVESSCSCKKEKIPDADADAATRLPPPASNNARRSTGLLLPSKTLLFSHLQLSFVAIFKALFSSIINALFFERYIAVVVYLIFGIYYFVLREIPVIKKHLKEKSESDGNIILSLHE
jgi:uncharacterized membrane protein YfcA